MLVVLLTIPPGPGVPPTGENPFAVGGYSTAWGPEEEGLLFGITRPLIVW